MSMRAILTLFCATVFGASAAVGVSTLSDRTVVKTVDPETTSVVVATSDIPRGVQVTPEMLALKEWPTAMVPANALTSLEDSLERSSLVPILAGEPISSVKLAEKGARGGLASLVPSGMRAYTIHTARFAANVAGFILPGDHVDVLFTLRGNQNDGTGGASTTTLLQNIEVLAVHELLDAPKENKIDPSKMQSVTLKVTPDQAAELDLGQSQGQLTLSLRNPQDKVDANTAIATLNGLRFQQGDVGDQESSAGESRKSEWLSSIAAAGVQAYQMYLTAKTSQPATATEPPPPEEFEIRTIRGNSISRVKVRNQE